MSQAEQRPTRQPDIDEIGINSFLVHNAKVQPLLKGEGVLVGNHFELITWRREGLIARLQMRGFNVRTIEDRIRYLPALPQPAPIGDFGRRALASSKERYSYFEPQRLRWCEVEPQADGRTVLLRAGWVVRRRRGRGHADYYLATAEKGEKIGLLPVSERDALLMGYAQATRDQPRSLEATLSAEGYLLPQQIVLPPPHQEIIKILGSRAKRRNAVPVEGLEHLRALMATLGLILEAPEPPAEQAEIAPNKD